MTRKADLEDWFAAQLDDAGIEYEREYRFAKHLRRPDTGRPYMYRSDFFIQPDILVEVEGGIWTGGRHTQPKGFIADIEKYNLAQRLGYRVIRTHRATIKDESAITLVVEMVNEREAA